MPLLSLYNILMPVVNTNFNLRLKFCLLNKKVFSDFQKLSIEKGEKPCYTVIEEKKGRYSPMGK